MHGSFVHQVIVDCRSPGMKMDGWMEGGMEGWRDGGMEGWRDGGMEGWMDGWMEGWMDSLLACLLAWLGLLACLLASYAYFKLSSAHRMSLCCCPRENLQAKHIAGVIVAGAFYRDVA